MQRLIICAVVLLVGVVAMLALASMKKPPAEARLDERPLHVEVQAVLARDVPVTISGYGEARPLDVVTISPEVSGRIVKAHPRLEAGEIIPSGETLFEIDARDYRADQSEATASVQQWRHTIQRLRKQAAIDADRLKTLRRSQRLAEAEFERLRNLYDQDRVGTRSGVDAAERAANTARDQADQMAQAVTLYPIQIQEAQDSLKAARARLEIATIRLERCVVAAPFTGRVRSVAIEQGQFVSAGIAAVTLADDSMLEIHVPIDSRDARRWLRFRTQGPLSGGAWFGTLEPVACRIRWTEALDGRHWQGTLHRVVEFNKETRTVTLAVRIGAKEAISGAPERMPLVEGMFCLVEIPGKVMPGVMAVPRWAVSFENTVFVARDRRLKTVPVQVARIQGDTAYVADGLAAGDRVIVTRLVDPLENALLKISPGEDQDTLPAESPS
ncbi:MAG: HlyD family efflux transporter periplasmic adaptor subunit [Desulfobacterales bacterium]|nr:HlyD family efflux transporter periplasmic adaptor subunit [Desulfobacterales bacterium]